MARRSRKELESDVKGLMNDFQEGFRGSPGPDYFGDLTTTNLYKYEKALKLSIKSLKPFMYFP